MAFPLNTLIPELDDVDNQMMFAVDPAQKSVLQKALSDAEALLAAVDKTKPAEYAGAMTQVIMLRRRLESNVTPRDLMTQRIAILEKLI
jgi:hypothetical protein